MAGSISLAGNYSAGNLHIFTTERKVVATAQSRGTLLASFSEATPEWNLHRIKHVHQNRNKYPYNRNKHPLEQTRHPFNRNRHPHEPTKHPFNRSKHPYKQTKHPFNRSKHAYEQTKHPHNPNRDWRKWKWKAARTE